LELFVVRKNLVCFAIEIFVLFISLSQLMLALGQLLLELLDGLLVVCVGHALLW
jgi:hypothetical protein